MNGKQSKYLRKKIRKNLTADYFQVIKAIQSGSFFQRVGFAIKIISKTANEKK